MKTSIENTEKERQMVFWKYDQPPYALYGEVLGFHRSGGVFVKGYDRNMTSYFRKESILRVCRYEDGLVWAKRLDSEEKEYEDTVAKAKSRLFGFLNELKGENS